ncbi:uncharacterized protein LOC123531591 isoform X3 [Mercenaria mercenaria]|uniref:uncharacterized protein LOC123531591 isoform X3 n=1 Tax=Mercenaria mercenaria TaxID=6596 RepID=UPI001E1D4C48|nr:uncharacterized protein LOC123531591 isoform X3 [Mercenaria mercenaria]
MATRIRTKPQVMEAKSTTDNLENISRVLKKVRDYAILVFAFVLYRLARLIVLTFQKFTWAVTGVEKTRRDAKSGLNFRSGAHVQDIKWRRKIHPLVIADQSNFITFHNSFKHPKYVLKPHISLYCVTKTEAVFVETDEKLDVHYNTDSNFYTTQFKHAKRMITMPLGVFHKLAQDTGDPRVPVVLISNTGRCGATLLSRMFEQVPGTRIIQEPDCLTTLAFLKRSGSLSDTEYDNVLTSAIRLLCKPDDKTNMLIIRSRPCCCVQIKTIQKLIPRIRHIFLYRNSLRTVSSYIGTMSNDTTAQCARFLIDNAVLGTFFPFLRKIFHHYFVHTLDQDPPLTNPADLTTVGMFSSVWAACVACAVECTEKNIPIISVLYDEMMKSPWRSCSVLFEKLNIRAQYVNAATQAFKVDVNKNQDVCQSFMNTDSRRTIPPEMRAEADAILRKYGFPKLGERFELNGLTSFEPPPFSKTLSRDKMLF